MNPNAPAYLQAYAEVFHHGSLIVPRNEECLEICDYKLVLDMNYSSLTSFDARKLNLAYAKQEFLWYLRGDKFDTTIENYAKMWAKIKQKDGSYNSNYGQYIFPDQFQFVVRELSQDRWSRRASIVLLKQEHLYHDNTDVVCTYSMNFRIRDAKLDMTVMMRSNDVIFGLTNDAFCFSLIYRMVYVALLTTYPSLQIGRYTHIANSLHVYSRHWDMIQEILDDGLTGYRDISIPWPDYVELMDLLDTRQTVGLKPQEIHNEFVKWLCTP